MPRYKKPQRTKEMESSLKDWVRTSKGDARSFIKKWGMSPSYMMTMYRPYAKGIFGYYCKRCKRIHKYGSKIAKEHKDLPINQKTTYSYFYRKSGRWIK